MDKMTVTQLRKYISENKGKMKVSGYSRLRKKELRSLAIKLSKIKCKNTGSIHIKKKTTSSKLKRAKTRLKKEPHKDLGMSEKQYDKWVDKMLGDSNPHKDLSMTKKQYDEWVELMLSQ